MLYRKIAVLIVYFLIVHSCVSLADSNNSPKDQPTILGSIITVGCNFGYVRINGVCRKLYFRKVCGSTLHMQEFMFECFRHKNIEMVNVIRYIVLLILYAILGSSSLPLNVAKNSTEIIDSAYISPPQCGYGYVKIGSKCRRLYRF